MKIIEIKDYGDRTIIWKKHLQSVRYWFAEIEGHNAFLRMNNFPEEPLYTLISNNMIKDYDDLPVNWVIE